MELVDRRQIVRGQPVDVFSHVFERGQNRRAEVRVGVMRLDRVVGHPVMLPKRSVSDNRTKFVGRGLCGTRASPGNGAMAQRAAPRPLPDAAKVGMEGSDGRIRIGPGGAAVRGSAPAARRRPLYRRYGAAADGIWLCAALAPCPC